MAQVSYGTITITDTNDVESIVIEYNRNQSTTTPPTQTDSGWSTNRPAWAQGYYIWQRTRTHKSGTSSDDDILGNAVCITGSTGQTGTSVSVSSIKYAVSDEDVTLDQSPYHYRQSPDAGSLDENIVGGTLGWNQLINTDSLSKLRVVGAVSTTVSNHIVTITANTQSGSIVRFGKKDGITSITGHKTLLCGIITASADGGLRLYDGTSWTIGGSVQANTALSFAKIYSVGSNGFPSDTPFGFMPSENLSSDTIVWKEVQIIDLTTLFGSTIADYIYSLEQSSAGAGVDWVRQYIDLDTYHEYCEPTLKSVEGLHSRDVVGFNQWDEETALGYYDPANNGAFVSNSGWMACKNYIPCLPNTDYYMKIGVPSSGSFGAFLFYDGDKNYISHSSSGGVANKTFTTPSNCHYMTFYANKTWFAENICINLSDPSKNGIYEPYEKHSYPMDSSVTLQGVPKLDSNNKLCFDGDIYPPSGKVARRYGLVDLGSLDWVHPSGNRSVVKFADIKLPVSASSLANCITSKGYVQIPSSGTITEGTFAIVNTNSVAYLYFYYDGTNIPSGDLVYELATPTTESAQPYQSPQLAGSTEEYVTTGVVPVGHESKYYLGTTTQPADSEFTYDNPPNVQDGQWLWVRTIYSDNSKTYLKTRQGSSGESGRSLSNTITEYTTAAGSVNITEDNMNNYTWSENVPNYSSSTPAYWVRVTNKYLNPVSVEYVIYKDNGITDAMSTAAAANQTANNAKEIAQQASTDVTNLQTRTKYFWTNLVAHTKGSGGWTKPDYPVGTFAASGISGTTFDYENSSTYGYNTLYSNGIKLRYNAINLGELTGSSLTFYRPSTTSQGSKGMELTSSALKFFDATGTVAQATFGGTQATISGTINVYDGKIGNNANNYWYIGNYTDYNQNTSAIIKSIGTASIQLNETNTWRISTNRIHTAWAPETGTDAFKLHFPKFNDSSSVSKYWDYGLHLPSSYSDKFLYIRNASGSESLENLLNDLDDAGYNYWNYKFYVDGDGNLHAGDIYSHDVLISGTSAPYLLKSGGEITGNLEVNGTLTKGGKNVAYFPSTPTNGQILVADGTGGGIKTSGYTIAKSVPSNAVFTDQYVQTVLDNSKKLYLTGTQHSGTYTGTLNYNANVYVEGDALNASTILADSAQLGDLIVTGAGRFANGLYGDLIGNADTATKAAKVADIGNGNDITLNYSGTNYSTTSWFAAWNGYQLGAISPANVLKTIGAVAKSGDTMIGTLTAPEFSLSGGINNTTAGFRLTNNGTNMDMGWTWTDAQGAGACFTSSSHPNQPGIFDFFARAKNSSNQEVTKHLIGNISGVLTWDNRRVVTATNSTAVGGTSTPIYIDANGYAQACTSISATSATKATQDADGNTISSTYLKLSGGTVTGITQFNKTIRDSNGQHYYGGAANRSRWYKITLAHNGVTPPSGQAQWYMCSMTLHIAGDYNHLPRGTIELCYYIYWDGSSYLADKVFATGYGPNINNAKIYYTLDDPFVIYVDTYNPYTSLWVDYVSYRDSAQSHNTKETKVETTDAITAANYSQVPVNNIYTYDGSGFYVDAPFITPSSNNNKNLGSTTYKWANVYATTFNGALSGNASSASKLNSTRSFTIGKTAKNVDWSGAVSFSKAEISDDASSTANGWMSVADKKKLDSITVSDIGTIGANSIRGEKDIKVTISSGIATIGHENAAITAGTISGTATSTLSNGGSFKIPSITYDAYGHITGTAQTTVTLPNITSVSGNAGTATKFSSARAISLSGDVSGTATADGSSGWSITTRAHYLTHAIARPASANVVNTDHLTQIYSFLASSSMTEGKPISDGTIIHFPWDNNGWAGQLYIPNSKNLHMQFRGGNDSSGNTNWEDWRTIIDTSNYSSYALPLTGGTLTGDLIVGTTDSPANIQIGAKNDNYGLLPSANNYNQIGKSGMSWYRAYISNYYGGNSMVTNWRSGNNIGYPSTSSANAERGRVNFYNDCTAGSTQTKTLLEASASATSNITLTLPNKTGTIALTSDNVASATTATYSYYPKFVASNEIRFDVNTKPSSAVTLCVGYKWSDATTDAKINRYAFYNGASALAEVAASTFYGDLSGHATSATKAAQDGDNLVIADTYLKKSGGTMTGTEKFNSNMVSIDFRDNASYRTGFYYGTSGNEALALAMQNAVTSFMVVHGSTPSAWSGGTWNTVTPTLQTKNNSLYVHELIPNTITPAYNFKVNGTSYLGGEVKISDTNADTESVSMVYDRDMQCLNFIFN